jgi:hypothetical protein
MSNRGSQKRMPHPRVEIAGRQNGRDVRHDSQMDDLWACPVEVSVGEMQVLVGSAAPSMLAIYEQHADLVEHFRQVDGHEAAGYFFVAINEGEEWPRLVVTQRFHPVGPGFAPGVLLVPEVQQLFIGAGTRLLGYDGRSGRWRRSWVDEADFGFWNWRRHDDVVVMSAELEFASWSTDGRKLWTTFVEPPWSYRVTNDQVVLDVMGEIRTFDLRRGP